MDQEITQYLLATIQIPICVFGDGSYRVIDPPNGQPFPVEFTPMDPPKLGPNIGPQLGQKIDAGGDPDSPDDDTIESTAGRILAAEIKKRSRDPALNRTFRKIRPRTTTSTPS